MSLLHQGPPRPLMNPPRTIGPTPPRPRLFMPPRIPPRKLGLNILGGILPRWAPPRKFGDDWKFPRLLGGERKGGGGPLNCGSGWWFSSCIIGSWPSWFCIQKFACCWFISLIGFMFGGGRLTGAFGIWYMFGIVKSRFSVREKV